MSAQSNDVVNSKTKLDRIMERAKRDPSAKWSSLIHVIDLDFLRECYKGLESKKAVGIDGVSKAEYGVNLEENLTDLLTRVRKRTYVPKPVRIVNIPKVDGTMRPLAICCLEDKIVQEALRKIIEAIYEPLFIESSHGYRPSLGCDTALKAVNAYLNEAKCGALIDIDLKSFFNSIPHEKLIKLLEMKIVQPDFIKLVRKVLRTPILGEDGQAIPNEVGVPQGSILSPVLANIYLHYAIDVWFKQIQITGILGYCNMVRYCDDAIFTFENPEMAAKFMLLLKERLRRFDIELNEDKTEIMQNGRKYAAYCESTNKKPPTFSFLGFRHYWLKSLNKKLGVAFWRPAVMTCPKRINKKLSDAYSKIKKRRHDERIIEKVVSGVVGHAAYFCVNDNLPNVDKFSAQIKRILFKWLNRRSQIKSLDWKKFLLHIEAKGYPRKFKIKNLFFNMKGC